MKTSYLSELLLIGPVSMVLPTQMAVCGVRRQDGYVGLLVNTGTGLQQLGVGVELTVGQQENAFPRSHCIMACWQTFLRQVVNKIFFHLAFKVFLIPFLFAECIKNRILYKKTCTNEDLNLYN